MTLLPMGVSSRESLIVKATSGLQVDPSNEEQAKAWGGEEGSYWAANADQFDRAVGIYHRPFLDAARNPAR